MSEPSITSVDELRIEAQRILDDLKNRFPGEDSLYGQIINEANHIRHVENMLAPKDERSGRHVISEED